MKLNITIPGASTKSALILLLFLSCKKAVQVDPPTTQPAASVVYSNDATATAVMTGLYSLMSTNTGLITGIASISAIGGYSADELKAYPTTTTIVSEAFANRLLSTHVPFWTAAYNYIYTINAAIEGVSSSPSISTAVRQQLIGEAKFMRAFFYFYLVNFFGDVPLVVSTDYRRNALLGRAPSSQIYQQIVNDLIDAQSLLNSKYLSLDLTSVTSERIRPNKFAATALLARVYLYMGEWQNAEAEATAIITDVSDYSLVTDLTKVFLKNSTEAIWQLQPVVPTYNTLDANAFILKGAPKSSTPGTISSFLLSAFEPGDKRKDLWIGVDSSTGVKYYYPFKYKVNQGASTVSEYLMVLRLAEQFLIRAEARAQLGNVAGSQSDLNLIRNRAGLSGIVSTDKTTLLNSILHERQVELFTEWGHRWFDLRRSGNIDAVMGVVTPQKGGSWSSDWILYPIPLTTIQVDPNITQNHGY